LYKESKIKVEMSEKNAVNPVTGSEIIEDPTIQITPVHFVNSHNPSSGLSDTVQAYKNLASRFVKKKLIYQEASGYFNKLDLIIFTAPLLVLQIANVIIPSILGTNSDDGAENLANNSRIFKIITTTISAISASWIAAQGRLNYGKLSEKYANIATTYDLLASNSFLKMTEVNILERDEDENGHNSKIFEKDLIEFLNETAKIEKNVRAGVKLPPYFIEEKVMKKYSERKDGDEKLKRKILDITSHEEVLRGVNLA